MLHQVSGGTLTVIAYSNEFALTAAVGVRPDSPQNLFDWSLEEAVLVRAGIRGLGHNWAAISSEFLPHRGSAQIANFFTRFLTGRDGAGSFNVNHHHLSTNNVTTGGADSSGGNGHSTYNSNINNSNNNSSNSNNNNNNNSHAPAVTAALAAAVDWKKRKARPGWEGADGGVLMGAHAGHGDRDDDDALVFVNTSEYLTTLTEVFPELSLFEGTAFVDTMSPFVQYDAKWRASLQHARVSMSSMPSSRGLQFGDDRSAAVLGLHRTTGGEGAGAGAGAADQFRIGYPSMEPPLLQRRQQQRHQQQQQQQHGQEAALPKTSIGRFEPLCPGDVSLGFGDSLMGYIGGYNSIGLPANTMDGGVMVRVFAVGSCLLTQLTVVSEFVEGCLSSPFVTSD